MKNCLRNGEKVLRIGVFELKEFLKFLIKYHKTAKILMGI